MKVLIYSIVIFDVCYYTTKHHPGWSKLRFYKYTSVNDDKTSNIDERMTHLALNYVSIASYGDLFCVIFPNYSV